MKQRQFNRIRCQKNWSNASAAEKLLSKLLWSDAKAASEASHAARGRFSALLKRQFNAQKIATNDGGCGSLALAGGLWTVVGELVTGECGGVKTQTIPPTSIEVRGYVYDITYKSC